MTTKAIGCLLLFACCAVYGYARSCDMRTQHNNKRLLKDLLEDIWQLCGESAVPIDTAIENIARQKKYLPLELPQTALARLQAGSSPTESLLAAAECCGDLDRCSPQIRADITDCLSHFGSGRREQDKCRFGRCEQLLSREIEGEYAAVKSRSKVCVSLSVLLGLSLCVLLW